MKRSLIPIAVFATMACGVVQSQVRQDVLLIERVEVAQERVLPDRGQLMAQVESQFGAPVRKHATVGGDSRHQPPITRWDYADFSVYFEHSHVVNTVIRKASPLETGPKPVG